MQEYIYSDQTVLEALTLLNELPKTLTLFVLNKNEQLVGTLTDGDIRRNLLKGKNTSDIVSDFMFTSFRFLRLNEYQLSDISIFKELNINQVPLIDKDNKIVRIINLSKLKSLLPLDAVVMAGGRGERLKPLTNTTPKPLLKIGNKPIIERNIDRLASYGIKNFNITIKYLGNQIVDYLGSGKNKEITIKYIEETIPLGTIGSVSLINDFEHDHILVMNSDLLTNIDFEDFYKAYVDQDADMAIASIPYKVNIPYAVLERDGHKITSFKEKPTYTYYSNAGIYIIRKELLKIIPVEEFFNATDFMEALIQKGKNVIHYPILGYWLDIGQHDEYAKAQEDVEHIVF
jgi:dTDP-glucose pyrophosphorylase